MFDGAQVGLTGLMEIVHPAGTIRLCDGGFLVWPGRGTFVGRDETFGTLGSVDAAGEALGDEAPGGRFSLLAPTITAAVALARADAQGSAVRMWMAEVDPALGTMVGTPEPLFYGMIDTVAIQLGRGSAEVVVEYVSTAERLFLVKEGNVLSDAFHQRAWPGELGFSLCTGSVVAVPWGVPGPPRGSINSGSSASYGGGGYAGGAMSLRQVIATGVAA